MSSKTYSENVDIYNVHVHSLSHQLKGYTQDQTLF